MAEELAAQEAKLQAIRERRNLDKQKRSEEIVSGADQTLKVSFPPAVVSSLF